MVIKLVNEIKYASNLKLKQFLNNVSNLYTYFEKDNHECFIQIIYVFKFIYKILKILLNF
jgi:hypothetical protein